MQRTNSKHNKTYFEALGGAINLKSRNSQKAHLWPLLRAHTKFQLLQLPSSLWREDRGATDSFQDQIEDRPDYLLS